MREPEEVDKIEIHNTSALQHHNTTALF